MVTVAIQRPKEHSTGKAPFLLGWEPNWSLVHTSETGEAKAKCPASARIINLDCPVGRAKRAQG